MQNPMLNIRLNYPQIAQTLNIPDLEQRLKAKSRARKLVDIRRALSAILVEQGYSVREIARELCRPHSTVVHFVQTHESLFSTDTAYQDLFHQLHHTLKETTP
jgi:chromosomal replication initiation ATPase DnaA